MHAKSFIPFGHTEAPQTANLKLFQNDPSRRKRPNQTLREKKFSRAKDRQKMCARFATEQRIKQEKPLSSLGKIERKMNQLSV